MTLANTPEGVDAMTSNGNRENSVAQTAESLNAMDLLSKIFAMGLL